jgi:hypothetical protein
LEVRAAMIRTEPSSSMSCRRPRSPELVAGLDAPLHDLGRGSDRQCHGREREHVHIDAALAGDDEVRARADRRHGAREGGDVRDRQEHLARRDPARLLELTRRRDQHRHERRGVDHRRGDADRRGQPPHGLACRLNAGQQRAGTADHGSTLSARAVW